MKRRTLIAGSLWSSILAIVTPVRAAFVSDSKPQTKKVISPYEATKMVYDGFSSQPDTEFTFDEPQSSVDADDYNTVSCKLVSLASGRHNHYDIWLVFNDTRRLICGTEIKTRELIVSQMLCKGVQQLNEPQKEYSVEEMMRSSWMQNGKHIVYVKEFYSKEWTDKNFQTGGLYKSIKHNDNTEIVALARFLSLIAC